MRLIVGICSTMAYIRVMSSSVIWSSGVQYTLGGISVFPGAPHVRMYVLTLIGIFVFGIIYFCQSQKRHGAEGSNTNVVRKDMNICRPKFLVWRACVRCR